MVCYPVLEGEIAKRGMKKNAIASSLGICRKSLNNKLSGRQPFTWPEVNLIKERFFPDMTLEALFERRNSPTHGTPEQDA